MLGYSKKCTNLTTHWSAASNSCVSCGKASKPGYEFSPNCGVDDSGGRREGFTRKCENNTFNDGKHTRCQRCAECMPGYNILRLCNLTADTECCQQGRTCPQVVTSSDFTEPQPSYTENPVPNKSNDAALWAVPVILGVSFVILIIAINSYFIYRRKKGICFRSFKRTTLLCQQCTSCLGLNNDTMPTRVDKNIDDFLNPQIQVAPLQTVLDNLDVLEELVILLDPDRTTVRNTRHLASRCSFTSTWITYAYSMKDTKSPLKAVLEGVTTKHPDWTVGHLGELLLDMRRIDALEILTKLELNEELV